MKILYILFILIGCGNVNNISKDASDATNPQTDAASPTCTANSMFCGSDNAIHLCEANGTGSSKVQDCAFSCSNSGTPHCLSLIPTYGVGAPTGVNAFDLDINNVATLDISSCTNTPNSVTLTIGTTTSSLVDAPRVAVVNQPGATPICVVKYHNIIIETEKVLIIKNNSSIGQVLALEAEGTINVQGTITFRNSASGSTKGEDTIAAPFGSTGTNIAAGAGGGGNAFAGGQGGTCFAGNCFSTTAIGGIGGAALSLSQLFAGSKGGDVLITNPAVTPVAFGGLGGGGLQLVALQGIAVGATGRIDINGLGGTGLPNNRPAGGGGAGGTLVIETRELTISQGAIVTANGGGGASGCFSCVGTCEHSDGQQGQLSAIRAAGGSCVVGGNGGFAANGSLKPLPNGQNASIFSPSTDSSVAGGGGGGGDGFIVLRTLDAAHRMVEGGSVISPPPVVGNVTTN